MKRKVAKSSGCESVCNQADKLPFLGALKCLAHTILVQTKGIRNGEVHRYILKR